MAERTLTVNMFADDLKIQNWKLYKNESIYPNKHPSKLNNNRISWILFILSL